MESGSASAVDAALLARIERAFEAHANDTDAIQIADLKRALGLRSPYLTQRVLAAFDADGDGVVSKGEFLAAVRALVLGDDVEKLRFAFRLHDHDGDGFLEREELLRMITISLAENDIAERASQPPSELAGALLAAANKQPAGRLAFEDFAALVHRTPELLAAMTRSEAIWIAPNEDLLLLPRDAAVGLRRRGLGWLDDHVSSVVVLTLWVLANLTVLAWSARYGRAAATGNLSMRIGRAVGACLDLNGALIFVPMMRRTLSRVRSSVLGRLLPVDDAVAFHKLVGNAMFGLAMLHGAAFVVAYAEGHGMKFASMLSGERALTGAVLLAVFAVLWAFALGIVRRSRHFELFYFSHLLYVAWLALALAHAPRLIAFAGVAFVGFLVESLLRLRRRRPASRVTSTWPLRSGVTRLELARPPHFVFSPGDYVFLRIPAIARHEWHPFTISSAPEVPNLTFHVRSLGNWSAALRREVEAHRAEELVAFVDGPYGSPTGHLFRSRFAVLIGAGIGVTPFASVLESIVLRADDQVTGRSRMQLEKVHFFWLNRDAFSFEWFRGLLSQLEERDERKLLDIHLCMTGARTGATALGLELAREAMHEHGRVDLVTGLRTKTHLGQVHWEALLGAIQKEHAPATVDVFFCGPRGLAKKLAPLCRRLGMTFREERF